MPDIRTLKISFLGELQPGPTPWMWASVEVTLEEPSDSRPTIAVQVPVPFEGQGVFEMREVAWSAFRQALGDVLAAGEGKSAQQLTYVAPTP